MPDIRANIIKMLQEGRDTTTIQSEAGDTPASPTVKVPPGEEDLFSIAEEQDKTEHQPAPAPATAVTEQQPPALKQQHEQYLELPSKQITIQDVDDLKKLTREFEEARKRQQGSDCGVLVVVGVMADFGQKRALRLALSNSS
jgi:hypothetical protein